MPPRSVIVAVLLFWLASSAWLFQREIRPLLAPEEPPRFHLAHYDNKTQQHIGVRWTVYHKTAGRAGRLTYKIQTTVVHHDKNREDLFELVSTMRPASDERQNFLQVFHLGEFETTYRVRRDGRMVGLKAVVGFRQGLVNQFGDQTGEFEGVVQGDHCHIEWVKQNRKERASGSRVVEVTHSGAVLLPLHPVETMPDLRPGQQWGLYLFDPLDSASTPSAPPRFAWVNAEVREQVEALRWQRRDYSCRVIDFNGEKGNIAGKIWVETETRQSKVLRYEFRLGDDTWEIRRGDDTEKFTEEEGS